MLSQPDQRTPAPRGGWLDFARALLIIIGAIVSCGVVWWLAVIGYDTSSADAFPRAFAIGVAVFTVFFLLPSAWINWRYFYSANGPRSGMSTARLPSGATPIGRSAGPRVEYADDPVQDGPLTIPTRTTNDRAHRPHS